MAKAMRTDFETLPIEWLERHEELFASVDAGCLYSEGKLFHLPHHVVQTLAIGPTSGSSRAHGDDVR
jgi:hypothetical protein